MSPCLPTPLARRSQLGLAHLPGSSFLLCSDPLCPVARTIPRKCRSDDHFPASTPSAAPLATDHHGANGGVSGRSHGALGTALSTWHVPLASSSYAAGSIITPFHRRTRSKVLRRARNARRVPLHRTAGTASVRPSAQPPTPPQPASVPSASFLCTFCHI